ncbi:hypothetical protein SAMN03159474_04055, partial [Pseudomonas sp. NFACC08-1]
MSTLHAHKGKHRSLALLGTPLRAQAERTRLHHGVAAPLNRAQGPDTLFLIQSIKQGLENSAGQLLFGLGFG